MDLRTTLCVLHTVDDAAFTDYSYEAGDFKRDTFTQTILSTDLLYIGHEKLINALYVELQTANTNTSTLSAQYYNGTVWTALDICDETNGFARSGFITWERPSDAEDFTVNGDEKCWYRFSVSADTSAVEFQAISLLFSDDNTMCSYEPNLIDDCYYSNGQTSHVLRHLSARNYIMSILASKADSSQRIDFWDVLDIYELREASNYYAIAQVYFNLSDNPEDHYWAKYQDYMRKFEKMFELGSVKIDLNGDNTLDDNEKTNVKSSRWSR